MQVRSNEQLTLPLFPRVEDDSPAPSSSPSRIPAVHAPKMRFKSFIIFFFAFIALNYCLLVLLFPNGNPSGPPIEYRFEQFPRRNSCDSSHFQLPVLVFACKRPRAIREHVEKLIKYRPNATQFPIYVSQDCDNAAVTKEIRLFGDSVSFTKFRFDKTLGEPVKRHMRQYYKIARHYKLGLDWVFENSCYDAVIVTEDDLDISADFFSYFSATLPLLKNDQSLWCVTAWNDNGQLANIDATAHSLLHRSDFFGGLGWMTTRKIWRELSPKWPDAFWDDWMRESVNRKGRQCVRPEISRTGMTFHGARGASGGKFHKEFTSKVHLFDKNVNFSGIDLSYLEPRLFKEKFLKKVRKAKTVTLNEFHKISMPRRPLKIFYNSSAFGEIAEPLGIMKDLSDGVPRTAYQNIVPIFKKGVQVFLVPDEYFHYF